MEPGFENRWKERFEEFAELRDDEAGIAGWSVSGLEARVRRFRSLWSPGQPGALWLDAGCGAGTYVRLLLQHGHRAIGVDYSLPTLRKTLTRQAGGAFLVSDVRALPFSGDQFDGVICFGVMQALSDSRPAVRELARQVKPGGELWIDALNQHCIIRAVDAVRSALRRRPAHLRYDVPSRLKRLLETSGLTDVRVHWMPIVPARAASFQAWLETAFATRLLRAVPALGSCVSHAFILTARKAPGQRAVDLST